MKERTLGTKLLLALVTLGVLAYFAIQAVRYFGDPLTTTLAYRYEVELSTALSGYVVRDETVLPDDTSGLLQQQRTEGERVSAGGVVALVYADQASLELQQQIQSLRRSSSCSMRRRRHWGRRSLCAWMRRSFRRSGTTGAPWRRTGWIPLRTMATSCAAW